MKNARATFTRSFLQQARHSLARHHWPRIARCLEALSEKEIWWRPNRASNSVGNIVLHLEGNIRQWIISGLGGEPDRRDRPREFSEQGPIPTRQLQARLAGAVMQATRVLGRLSPSQMARLYTIQGFRVSGITAIQHALEHLAYHAGQIAYVTKLKHRKDLGFTHLPSDERRARNPNQLPVI